MRYNRSTIAVSKNILDDLRFMKIATGSGSLSEVITKLIEVYGNYTKMAELVRIKELIKS